MAYKQHFSFNLDYSANKYFRVKKQHHDRFQVLKNQMKSKAKHGKLIAESVINEFFSLMIDIEDEELKYYIAQADEHFDEIMEYFMEPENILFENIPKKERLEAESQEMPEGLWGMVFEILYDAIRVDKLRHKPLKKDECIEELIKAMLTYRNDSMAPEVKEKYTLFRIAVMAAFIAHRIFNLMPATASFSNAQYYEVAQTVMSKHPKLLEGLSK